jgi:hypothetical protein
MECTTPQFITNTIRNFCKEIDSTTNPLFVPVEPKPSCEINDCFNNVERQIKRNNGNKQHGWIIWEIPDIFLEAEFHAVWVDESGKYIDITPKLDSETVILFHPDSKAIFQNKLVDNIRNPLVDNEDTRRLVNSGKLRFELRNRHFKNGKVDVDAVSQELTKIWLKTGRNDRCPCGSGNKFKKCCGR